MSTTSRSVTVLVIEDDEAIAITLQDVLEAEGYRTLLAANGREGLAALESTAEHRPDLILLDLFMPVMNGLEFLDAMAARPDGDRVPVILMSAAGSRAEEATRRASAAIKKPIDLDLLFDVLRRFETRPADPRD